MGAPMGNKNAAGSHRSGVSKGAKKYLRKKSGLNGLQNRINARGKKEQNKGSGFYGQKSVKRLTKNTFGGVKHENKKYSTSRKKRK